MASPASTNSPNSNTSLNSRNAHSLPQRGTPIRRGCDRPIPNAPRALRNRGGPPRGGGGPGPSSSGGGFHHPQDRDRHWRTSSGGGSCHPFLLSLHLDFYVLLAFDLLLVVVVV